MLTPENTLFSAAMRRACEEARLWLGATSPNPAVGAAALDEHGEILALTAHQRAGQDHAEAALLKMCRAQNLINRVHTLCVTLEPCTHQGRTPPCSQAIIDAGVRRVVVGARDPNPYVTGGGIEKLRAAGIEVIEDVESEMCRRLIHAFAYQARTGMPFVTIKRAINAQGSMLPPSGQKTFTSQQSLILAHRLRKKADAIITGSGTILADHPLFTVRHVPDFVGKRRVLAILDRRARVPKEYIEEATQRGLEPIIYRNIDSCLSDLISRGTHDILVESGPILSRFLCDSAYWTMRVDIQAGKVDQIAVGFRSESEIPFDTKDQDLESLLPL